MDQGIAAALVRRESNGNPFAIGLDGKAFLRAQPRTLAEAIAAVERLVREGRKFSVGLAQIHISNIKSFGATWHQSFEPCTNLRYGQTIYQHFLARARQAGLQGNAAVFAALRGYNSGNIFNPVSNDYAAAILTNGGSSKLPSIRASPPRAPPASLPRASLPVALAEPGWRASEITEQHEI